MLGIVETLTHTPLQKAQAKVAYLQTQRTSQENARKALVERSAGAQMLVLGSRGLGGIQSLLLGSVSAHCATQAHCPVLIVR